MSGIEKPVREVRYVFTRDEEGSTPSYASTARKVQALDEGDERA